MDFNTILLKYFHEPKSGRKIMLDFGYDIRIGGFGFAAFSIAFCFSDHIPEHGFSIAGTKFQDSF